MYSDTLLASNSAYERGRDARLWRIMQNVGRRGWGKHFRRGGGRVGKEKIGIIRKERLKKGGQRVRRHHAAIRRYASWGGVRGKIAVRPELGGKGW